MVLKFRLLTLRFFVFNMLIYTHISNCRTTKECKRVQKSASLLAKKWQEVLCLIKNNKHYGKH